MVGRTRSLLNPVRMALWLDAGSELAGALALSLASGRIADLLNVDSAYIWLAAAVFLFAAIGVASIALIEMESRELVWALATGNVLGGIAGWLVFVAFRDELDPGGRWLLTAAADTFLIVGLLEFLALRRSPPAAA